MYYLLTLTPAQIPGAEEAITAAARTGWEAVFLVVIVLAIITSFGYTLKRILDAGETREKRLADRVSQLESDIRNELFVQIKSNTEIMHRMIGAAEKIAAAADKMLEWSSRLDRDLAVRPCLMRVVHQGKFLEELEDLYARHSKANGTNP
jgi:hypothetical protein